MSVKALLNDFKQKGFHKSLRGIFPVRKAKGETKEELRISVERKLSFDIGLLPLKALGNFAVHSSIVPEQFASGVVALQIAKNNDAFMWLSLGERLYDVHIKLGESRETAYADGELLEQRDCSHITQDMIQSQLPKFLGLIKQQYFDVTSGHVVQKQALCYDLQVENFEPPIVKFQIKCGAGFSVKSFSQNLASELGTVAHVTHMHRSRLGPFTYEEAIPSYAISWDTCKKTSEKYADQLREHNQNTRLSFTPDLLKAFLPEDLLWKMQRKNRKPRAAPGASEPAS